MGLLDILFFQPQSQLPIIKPANAKPGNQGQATWAAQQAITPVQGHWVNDIKTGTRWATAPITADKSKVLNTFTVPGLGLSGEVLGPFPKSFTRSMFGQNLFTEPESVNGIPILCQCRNIWQYVRSPGTKGRILNAEWAILFAKTPPACWEDSTGYDFSKGEGDYAGGMTFTVTVRHPEFYRWMISESGGIGMATTLAKDAGMIKLLGFSGDTILGAVAAADIYKKATTPGGFSKLAKAYTGPLTLPTQAAAAAQAPAAAPAAKPVGGRRKQKTQKKRKSNRKAYKKKTVRKN